MKRLLVFVPAAELQQAPIPPPTPEMIEKRLEWDAAWEEMAAAAAEYWRNPNAW
jgi:hypothetical protein